MALSDVTVTHFSPEDSGSILEREADAESNRTVNGTAVWEEARVFYVNGFFFFSPLTTD